MYWYTCTQKHTKTSTQGTNFAMHTHTWWSQSAEIMTASAFTDEGMGFLSASKIEGVGGQQTRVH